MINNDEKRWNSEKIKVVFIFLVNKNEWYD